MHSIDMVIEVWLDIEPDLAIDLAVRVDRFDWRWQSAVQVSLRMSWIRPRIRPRV